MDRTKYSVKRTLWQAKMHKPLKISNLDIYRLAKAIRTANPHTVCSIHRNISRYFCSVITGFNCFDMFYLHSFNDNRDTSWLNGLRNSDRDLFGESLLNLQPTWKNLHNSENAHKSKFTHFCNIQIYILELDTWFVNQFSNLVCEISIKSVMAQQNFEMDLMCNTKTTNQKMNEISKVSRE